MAVGAGGSSASAELSPAAAPALISALCHTWPSAGVSRDTGLLTLVPAIGVQAQGWKIRGCHMLIALHSLFLLQLTRQLSGHPAAWGGGDGVATSQHPLGLLRLSGH